MDRVATACVAITMAAAGCGGEDSGVDAGEFRSCADRDLGTESGTFFGEGPQGALADASTVFTVSGRTDQEALDVGFSAVEVYVFDDSEAAEDAASAAADDIHQESNVVWTAGIDETPPEVSTALENCIGEAS